MQRRLVLRLSLLGLIFASFSVPVRSAAAKSAVAKSAAAKSSDAASAAATSAEEALLPFESLEWREVGPYRGGRSAAATGIPGERQVYYFGATGGGVWKTLDAGKTWKPVSDGFFGGSIGAVAVSAWDPNVVYVGGGEKTVRGNVSHGDGVWKSTDAGKTWTHVGLPESRHIPRIRIHPRDPELVYAAVLGHLYGPNEERGVYRSRDGGVSWQRVLHVSDDAGAVDLAMDPSNPRILYAALWQVRRTPWSLESGGKGSGLWKSTDGGDTWDELSTKPGFPAGTLGIIGVDVSASNPENLYALVEAEKGGVFRSKDGGDTWTKVNDERKLRQRAWYYTRITADPADQESVYVLNVRFHRSKDGGKTFTEISTPHGDNHDLWIDPGDPLRMIEANDGGANITTDGGVTWSVQSNQPTAQMYRVSTDNAFPYRLLGGQQDNSAVRIRSRSAFGGAIGVRDWESTAGGESGHIVAKPDDPDIVYGGSYGGYLVRFDHRTGERRAVNVWPDNPMGWGAADLEYRFQWNFPLFFSPHDPNTLYAAGNVLFVSRDEGDSWQPLGGDLTRNDADKMGPSGGPITKDNTSVEYYGTIFAAVESPHEAGVLWAGTDDGLIQLSRDGGNEWADVTPKSLPEWTQINSIDAHPFEPGGLYVAGTRYKLDDFTPYLFKTIDYGQSWQRIDEGIDRQHFTRVIRADPDRRGLLYAGTENGVYVSFDDGAQWQSLQLELPWVPVTDMAVKEQDLVVATQGRGYWILDDLTVLHQHDPQLAETAAHLFEPSPTHRFAGRGTQDDPVHEGKNPPSGVVFHFFLADDPNKDEPGKDEPNNAAPSSAKPDKEESSADEAGESTDESTQDVVKLEILEQGGDVIRTFTPKPKPGEDDDKEKEPEPDNPRQLELEAGGNRFVWDMQYPGARKFPGLVLWNSRLDGPRAVPGTYRARLTVGEWSAEVPFEILPDPRSSATQDDFQAQFDFLIAVRDKLSETHDEIGRLRDARTQIEALGKRLADTSEGEEGASEALIEAGKTLAERLTEIEKALYQTQNRSRQDPLNFPIRLNDKLAGLLSVAAIGDRRPTESMLAVRAELTAAIDVELSKLRAIWETDLPAYNALAREHEVDRVLLKNNPQ